MIVCDRCEGRFQVELSTAEFYTGNRPSNANQTVQNGADLCRQCREDVQRAIAAAFEPLAKQAPK